MSLLQELKRRNVIRVGIAYVVIAWIIAQVADLALESFKAPDWVIQTVLLLLALGLPLALFFAWAFEITPEGIKKEKHVDRSQSITHSTGRKLDFAIIGLLVVALAYFVWESRFSQTDETAKVEGAINLDDSTVGQSPDGVAPTDASEASPSIAVLPFADMSSQGDQEYFADGIAEELLNLLARTEGLKVAARTSSFKFKNTDKDIAEIGQALKVANVLEGSIRKSGTKLRITAQLIEVGTGFHVWSDTYDRELDDIFAVQDEISRAIVEALKLKLDINVNADRKVNGKAYELYLRGRERARALTKEDLLQAIDLYEQAISIDDSLAAAYAGIADAWLWLENYGGIKRDVAYPKAEQAARRAMALDPEMAEAHAAMGRLSSFYYNDRISARQYHERALELNPNLSDSILAYAFILNDQGEWGRSLKMHRQAVELDPLSVINRVLLAIAFGDRGNFEESLAIFSSLLEEDPDNPHTQEGLGHYYFERGEFSKAAEQFFLVHQKQPGDAFFARRLSGLMLEFEEPDLAQYWIAQSRARGADNTHELRARESFYRYTDNWLALVRLSSQFSDSNEAEMLGLALMNQGKYSEARAAYSKALELKGYKEGASMTVDFADTLIELLWTEQQLGVGNVLPCVAEVEMFFSSDPHGNASVRRAQLASIRGDKAVALEYLNTAATAHQLFSWTLHHDMIFAAWRDDPEFTAIIDKVRAHAMSEKRKLEKSANADAIFGRVE